MTGETIGSYRVLSELGSGGMGTVYLAEHRHLGRKAAIKVLRREFADRPDLLERFFSEARATSLVEHPGIVRIFDCEVDGQGRPYIVMEYLTGETLATYLRRCGPIAVRKAIGLARAAAEALGAAHDKKIIHRDVKPDNVFVLSDEPAAVKMVDFGIAKLAGGFTGSGRRTQTGVLMGTPLYMSPEQCRGAGTVDHRTDVYSLGCILFEMVCGRPPFVYEGLGELVTAHMTQTPPPARSINPQVPPALEAVIDRMLAKPVDERVGSMRAAAAELGALVEPFPAPRQTGTTFTNTAAEVVPGGDDEDEAPARNRRPLAWGAVVLVAGLGAAALWTKIPPAETPALAPALAPSSTPSPATAASPPPPSPLAPSAAAPPPSPPSPVAASGSPPKASLPAPREAPAAVAPSARPPAPAVPGVPRAPVPARAGAARTPVPPLPAVAGTVAAAAAAARSVRITLDSVPPGATVCAASDRKVVGRTSASLDLPATGKRVAFLVRLPGHRVEAVTLRADRDQRKLVTLQPLGPDDLEPADPCRR